MLPSKAEQIVESYDGKRKKKSNKIFENMMDQPGREVHIVPFKSNQWLPLMFAGALASSTLLPYIKYLCA